MVTIDKLSSYLANSITKYDENRSPAVMKYMIKVLLNFVFVIGGVLIISGLTGHFIDALACVWAFPLLRHISGGMHFKSNGLCNVVSIGFILTSVFFPINYWYAGFIINIIAVIVLLIWSPNGVTGTMDPKNYPKLKVAAVIIVACNFIFQSHSLALSFLIQAITTIPYSQKLIHKLKL